MKFIHLLRYKFKIFLWFLRPKVTPLDFFGEAIISMSAKWHGEINPVLSYICMFDVLRQRGFSGSFLELGGGYSTITLPNILDPEYVSATSVDLNPDKYNWILNSSRAKKDFLSTIRNVQKPTVSLQEVFEGLESLRLNLLKFDRAQVQSALSKYALDSIDTSLKISNAIFSDSGDDLKSLIVSHHAYSEDLKFYKSQSYESGFGYCHELVQQKFKADAIFFDCGEISSAAEWVILSGAINIGGYALLHDIYYPKSIKNFLVATYIELSSDWEIIYRDSVSPQGAMVAVRVG